MQTRLLASVLLFSLSAGFPSDGPAADKRGALHALLWQNGPLTTLLVRQNFSASQDLMIKADNRSENGLINFSSTHLVKRGAPLTEASLDAGTTIHLNGDDSTPWFINGTYIGGNHGCLGVIEVTSPAHTLTVNDTGSSWQDAAGTAFYVIAVPGPDKIWLLSDDTSTTTIWKFSSTLTGSLLKGQKGNLPVKNFEITQLRPACRINKQEILAGERTPLVSGQPISCDYLDVIEDYDIINPRAVLAEARKNPGRPVDFTAAHLDAVIHNRIVYRLYPNGATVITHTAKALEPFELSHMGFVQQNLLWKHPSSEDHREYYIPKTIPFTQGGKNYDFQSIQEFDTLPSSPLYFSREAKSLTSENLPDRFIQFLTLGRQKRAVGFAMGYSLAEGITVPVERSRLTRVAGLVFTSGKTYPRALQGLPNGLVTAGTTYTCVAYRQYFNPAAHPGATAVYWHPGNGYDVVYADYHRNVSKERLILPAHMVGRSFSLVEKSDSVNIDLSGVIPEAGLPISVANGYGYLVLKVPNSPTR